MVHLCFGDPFGFIWLYFNGLLRLVFGKYWVWCYSYPNIKHLWISFRPLGGYKFYKPFIVVDDCYLIDCMVKLWIPWCFLSPEEWRSVMVCQWDKLKEINQWIILAHLCFWWSIWFVSSCFFFSSGTILSPVIVLFNLQ